MKVTDDSYIQLINRLRRIVETGQRQAYADVSRLMTETYWKVGQTIVEIIQTGDSRAIYGNGVMKLVANSLSAEFGDAYSLRNLQYMRKFYLMFPDFEKVNTRVHFLSWSHYRALHNKASLNRHQVGDDLKMPVDFGLVPWKHHIFPDWEILYPRVQNLKWSHFKIDCIKGLCCLQYPDSI